MNLRDSDIKLTGLRVVVCALVSARVEAPEALLDAMARELERAGAVVVGRMLQRRGVSRSRRPGGAAKMDQPMGRGLFSGGKVDELAALMRASEASLLIVHNAITSGQRRVLTAATGCDVYSLPTAV